jgi:hypothetical protein
MGRGKSKPGFSEKMREVMQSLVLDPSYQEKLEVGMRRVRDTEEYRESHRRGLVRWRNGSKKGEIDASVISATQTPAYRENMRQVTIKRLIDGCFPQTNTRPHRILRVFLQQLGFESVSEWRPSESFPFGPIDEFVLILNTAFEADGEYWHGTEEAKERDWRKDQCLLDLGINVVRMGEIELDRIGRILGVEDE